VLSKERERNLGRPVRRENLEKGKGYQRGGYPREGGRGDAARGNVAAGGD